MLDPQTVSLIEPDDGLSPRDCRLSVVAEGDVITIPISEPPAYFVLLLTIGLFILGTPLCFVVYASMPNQPVGNETTPIGFIVFFAWVIGVFGPAAYWLFWPPGMLRPDHWLRFDRQFGMLSIRGGWSTIRLEEIVCLISVTDLRRKRTEFQVLSGNHRSPEKHLIASCRVLDPFAAFGEVLRKFGVTSDIPAYVATISSDGKIAVTNVQEG